MNESKDAASRIFGASKTVGQAFDAAVITPAAIAYNAVTRDGVIGASFNQMRDELSQALKAFPDSIHVAPVSVTGQTEMPGHDEAQHGIHGAKEPASPSQIAREHMADAAHDLAREDGFEPSLEHQHGRTRH